MSSRSSRDIRPDGGLEALLAQCGVYEHLDSAVSIFDRQGLCYANAAFSTLNRSVRDTPQNFARHPGLLDCPEVAAWLVDSLASGEVRTRPLRGYYSPHIHVDLTLLLRPVFGGGGELQGGFLTLGEESVGFGRHHLARLQDAYRTLVERIKVLDGEKVRADHLVRLLLKDAPIAMVLSNDKRQIVQANRAAEQLFGVPMGQLIGHGCETILSCYARCGHCPALAAGKIDREAIEGSRPEGGKLDLLRNAVVVEAGGETMIIEAFVDIGERKRAEAALLESRNLLQAVIDTVPMRVFWKDRSLRYLGCNPVFARDAGKANPSELLGKDDHDLGWAGLADLYQADDRKIMETGESRLAYEEPQTTPDGREVWLRTSKVPLKNHDGETIGVLGLYDDITEHRRMLEELRQHRTRLEDLVSRRTHELEKAKEAAEAASIAKSQFLATMSHELRTPMNGILGMAQLLSMPNLEETERQEYVQIILNSGQALLTLLNDILDLSKIEAGQVELEKLVFSPEQLLREIAVLSEYAKEKGLKLDVAWNGTPNVRYRSDPTRLRQMLSNLVSNAIKFTAQGFIRIEGRELETTGHEARLEFSVTDSGIGIPADKHALLFKPFSQLDASTTRKYGGTGLGLSIVRNLAQLMGGDVGVESREGRGTRMWFHIRVGQVEPGKEGRSDGSEAFLAKVPAPAAVANAGFILVVEDNVTNRLVIGALLKKLGCKFECVVNGQEALDAITRGALPDLVLMDCQMPVMDGYQATRGIRRWEQETGSPRVPIIALTAAAFEEDQAQCRAVGMDDFLAKPVSITDLRAALRKWVNTNTS